MTENQEVAYEMTHEICPHLGCRSCKLNNRNNIFNISLCTYSADNYTDEMVEFIAKYYHECLPNGELNFNTVEVSAAEIINMLGD